MIAMRRNAGETSVCEKLQFEVASRNIRCDALICERAFVHSRSRNPSMSAPGEDDVRLSLKLSLPYAELLIVTNSRSSKSSNKSRTLESKEGASRS